MVVCKVFRITNCISRFRIPATTLRRKCLRNYVSNASTPRQNNSLWESFKRKLTWTVPIGIGVSLIALLQLRHLRRHPYPNKEIQLKTPINELVVKCYCGLPLRISSRIWGWIANTEVPVGLRPVVYGFYAKTFSANLQDIDTDLSAFPTLVDFFVRPLKSDARPIAQNTNIVSPSDGKVIHFGPVTSCQVEQVKGMTYNLKNFFGEFSWSEMDKLHSGIELEGDEYVTSLLKNPENQMYQLTVYLAPGDYHRFHSSTDWKIEFRRHFQGKLLSVNPRVASWLPDLFSINERVTYFGEWVGGFMAYTAVGATNVGSIRVYSDEALTTNTRKWKKGKHSDDLYLDYKVGKGELFGEFRMGSTVVLLFEAPKDFQFCVKPGQSIKVGQALSDCAVQEN
ncbi:phosphatidylserine decarboxylase proenzyme, mitochondrial isoform X2 [Orussus abietinus]|uniref:phosphatidylserine decarboxylase proenzyme, mitochondrial isoform X2 n=1 Tax=Orussus abietinus TaxID=222816 RepID=UPI000C7160B9|nr:phosphatidylserine decarboxylase proenzyme, mitochondrial isoform X2 [Orussus abietinus]